MSERKYLPTFAELVDRLCIVQLKEINLDEKHREAYREEKGLILHDIELLVKERSPLDSRDILAIAVLMLSNATIWANESKAREGGSQQDHLLKFTHSINGVRNTAKNIIARNGTEREDLKVDCFAASLPEEYKGWSEIFHKCLP